MLQLHGAAMIPCCSTLDARSGVAREYSDVALNFLAD
jgi:hypothetical protein